MPDVQHYEPTDTGESPLAAIPEFVNTPRGKRETDTMGTFACSAWYYLRFADPHNSETAFDKEQVAYWLPVDMYVGGAEHAVMHLLYARFWTKALHDLGYVPFVEPFKRLRNQGMILAPDGKEKMSKSKGNVITPDETVAEWGADALRAYEMFISDFEMATPWNYQRTGRNAPLAAPSLGRHPQSCTASTRRMPQQSKRTATCGDGRTRPSKRCRRISKGFVSTRLFLRSWNLPTHCSTRSASR